MAPIGKLYAPSAEAGKAWRSFAAAKYAGLELEFAKVDMQAGDHKKADYVAKFPMGKVPAFESTDGFTLTESRAIARYIAGFSKNTPLLGTDEKSAAKVDQWVQFADDEIFNHALSILLPKMGAVTYSKQSETKYWDNLTRGLTALNEHLKTQTYLVGHRVSLADLVVVSSLRFAFTTVVGAQRRSQYPNVMRFFNTIHGQPTIADIAKNSSELVQDDFKYTAPKKETPAAAPKAAAAPTAAAAGGSSKKSKSKKNDDDDDDEPLVPAEPKAKNPLDDLPKSSFVLDEWKRVYSNKDTRSEAIPWFYENFDKEGYSVWRFDFKYNEELTQIFMSANQIGGFFNRLEASRKYVMGVGAVFGEANNSLIAGVLICRGKDYEPVLSVAPDLESYKVTPLDLSKPEDKKLFEDFLAWEATIDGKPQVESASKICK